MIEVIEEPQEKEDLIPTAKIKEAVLIARLFFRCPYFIHLFVQFVLACLIGYDLL